MYFVVRVVDMIWECAGVLCEQSIKFSKKRHQEDERKMGKEKVYLDKNFLIKHVSLIVLLPTREILMYCLLMFLSWQKLIFGHFVNIMYVLY